MKFDKITQLRFLILDWCLSDKEHKYTYEELTARMAEALFGDSSFSILPNLVDDDINAIQNYIALDTQNYILSYGRWRKMLLRIRRSMLPYVL